MFLDQLNTQTRVKEKRGKKTVSGLQAKKLSEETRQTQHNLNLNCLPTALLLNPIVL